MLTIIDQHIVLAFYGFFSKTSFLSFLTIFFAEWFPYLFVLAVLFLVSVRHTPKTIIRPLLLIFLPAVIAWIFADVIKFLLPAARPFVTLHLTPLVSGENPLASFPSGHATFFSAIGTTLFFRDKKIGSGFLLGALLIGFARIAAGIHYPSDILAGFLLGGAIAVLGHWIWSKFSKD